MQEGILAMYCGSAWHNSASCAGGLNLQLVDSHLLGLQALVDDLRADIASSRTLLQEIRAARADLQ
jgi:hypothetical protein